MSFFAQPARLSSEPAELGPVEVELRCVEHVDAGFAERPEHLFELGRRPCDPARRSPGASTARSGRRSAAPRRPPRASRARPRRRTACARAAFAAPAIGATVRLLPQERVGQVAVRAVDRDAVEADRGRVARAARVRREDLTDLGLAERRARSAGAAGRRFVPDGPQSPRAATAGSRIRLVPQLRDDLAAAVVNQIDARRQPASACAVQLGGGAGPTGSRAKRGGMVDPDPTGDDQPRLAVDAPAEVSAPAPRSARRSAMRRDSSATSRSGWRASGRG